LLLHRGLGNLRGSNRRRLRSLRSLLLLLDRWRGRNMLLHVRLLVLNVLLRVLNMLLRMLLRMLLWVLCMLLLSMLLLNMLLLDLLLLVWWGMLLNMLRGMLGGVLLVGDGMRSGRRTLPLSRRRSRCLCRSWLLRLRGLRLRSMTHSRLDGRSGMVLLGMGMLLRLLLRLLLLGMLLRLLVRIVAESTHLLLAPI
jgi:hypothetical protein